ncbi:MAG TPA: nuclear transport factor 2 family protein [Candidatus Binatia bacterium]|jgi:ketosteroid isomerase-like protein
MMSKDQSEVYKANENFYRTFESFDMAQMEQIWLRADYIQCFHPGWGMLRGWEPVMTSWRRIFENTEEIRFLLTEPRVEVRDALAWVTVYENLTHRIGQEVSAAVVLATNIFEKHPAGWLMIHHHGSPVAQPPTPVDPSTVH